MRAILSKYHDFDPHDPEAISFWNTAVESVMFDKMIAGMDEFFLAVSIVTLMLGGIGVMNIMLIAVRERTREIGVRKAIGATARSIQWQFFAEGLLLTGLSGLIGLVDRPGPVQPGQPGADAGALLGDDRDLAVGPVRRRRADAHRRRRVDLPGAPRRQPAAHRGAAVRGVAGSRDSGFGIRDSDDASDTMLLKEVLNQAWDSLVAHRFRAGLTMLGIAWGIMTVTSLMAYGNGFHNALIFGFSNAFSNGVARHLRRPDEHAGRRRARRPAGLPEGRRHRAA